MIESGLRLTELSSWFLNSQDSGKPMKTLVRMTGVHFDLRHGHLLRSCLELCYYIMPVGIVETSGS